MKIAYAQMKISSGHPDVNTKKILHFIEEAKAQGADMIIFPPESISGQILGGEWFEESFRAECEEYSAEIVAASKNIYVVLGMDMESFIVAKDGKHLDARKLPIKIEVAFNDGDFDHFAKLGIKLLSEPFSIDRELPAEDNDFPVIRVGFVGLQNTGKTVYTFDGASAVFNSDGEVVQIAEPFKECLNFVELEEIDKMPALEVPPVSETEEIYRAISYGVKNFLEQIGMKKVVVGVSGGIDSAVAAALYTQILGAENVYLVNMPSKFNSSTTKNLSEQLAKNLGCKYFVVPIQESVDWTVKQLEERGIEVSSFVKENIQARDRSARILAAIAAAVGGGFTCNANKAESTVGYATLYGDEAGFLSALADLWKFQVFDLARYLNEKIFGREVIPQGIIDIVPSAELSTAQNVDEGKGDPLRYDYHDYLLRAFAEDNLTPEELLIWYVSSQVEDNIGCKVGLVEKYFPTPEEFIADLERWWKQFKGMGVAKRIQSPPILAVTDLPYGATTESQNGWHFTKKYLELKNRLLAPYSIRS